MFCRALSHSRNVSVCRRIHGSDQGDVVLSNTLKIHPAKKAKNGGMRPARHRSPVVAVADDSADADDMMSLLSLQTPAVSDRMQGKRYSFSILRF